MRFKNTEISRNPFICYGGYQTTGLLVFVFHVDFSIPACFHQWQWLPYSRCIKFKHINIEMMLAAATFACTFVAVQSFVPGRTFSSTSKPITALAPPIKATHYESIAEIRQVKVIKSDAHAFSDLLRLKFSSFMRQGLQDGMKMRKLPRSDLLVSELCLGTMTFGEQNTKEQSFRQLDMATKEYGINFLVSF
jgi:hypothetical protein